MMRLLVVGVMREGGEGEGGWLVVRSTCTLPYLSYRREREEDGQITYMLCVFAFLWIHVIVSWGC